MALRIVETHVPVDLAEDAREILESASDHCWTQEGGRFGRIVSAVVGAQQTGEVLDRLHARLADRGGLLVLVEPLDGVLPRPPASPTTEARAEAKSAAAVSREEVYANIADTAQLDRIYVALVILASIVAGIGMAKDNTAAVIGAMVVAPLLGPNMALALGMVLGDGRLVRRSLITNAAGLALCFAAAMGLGFAIDADPRAAELAARTRVGVSDLVLALAAGCAGALSYTTGVPTYLTGVMVAVALLPPAVASGILLAQGSIAGAAAALLLVLGNITALTLAAMLTFSWRGMRPRNFWQEDRARRTARIGVVVFAGLLAVLATLIVVSQRYFAN